MSTSPTLKISNSIILSKNKLFPSKIEGYKVIYIMKKTHKTYCNVCASKFKDDVLTGKLAFFEDDQNLKCNYCKKGI
jgi:hypothetical protein